MTIIEFVALFMFFYLAGKYFAFTVIFFFIIYLHVFIKFFLEKERPEIENGSS